MSMPSTFYDENSRQLSKQYNDLEFETVHNSWSMFWPSRGERVLDVGAGSGRDALWMANRGADVIAIEPSLSMLSEGRKTTGSKVTWLSDELPSLKKIENLAIRFDLILVSAVWMHLAPTHRARAFRKLSNLLSPNGKLVISLRHGEFSDGRKGYPVSVEEIEVFAKDTALLVKHISSSEDSRERKEVTWQTVVMSLPDDGSGDLNKVRHIIVNDSKSSTYKLGLLRVLLRIADAHPGCVMDRSDAEVSIPLGLVALYWIKAYKRLIDRENLQQNSNSKLGLAFITADGWEKIPHLLADDLAVGSLFYGEEAKAIQKTIQASIRTMKEGPIKFIYSGSLVDKNQEFTMQPPLKRRREQSSICLDSAFFESFGAFVLKESLWDCFRLYNSWIEPLVVNQWVMQMQRFELNKQNKIMLQTYHNALVWLEKDHDTKDVRKRVKELQENNVDLTSVWSNTKLTQDYHVDHCLPFAYWPNNDKWNLLPTTKKENLNKKDRLPNRVRLVDSKHRVLDWWQLAWGDDINHSQRFFTEASLSLPNIPPQCSDFEQVFEAMGLQISGVKSRLLVGEW
ncbi:class I SAM-dependent methyltransferase [Vibrio algarum]|uniref:Class I SAM-dependent methyltransferase n=1 Tax=Vibrio algarum TaxID=3020714 RepID=A0ABT4YRQ6_9VIBR|nr:class I SAM-dependent methyltransferase [Vibrio sp. KJ40-1]MDB1124235.1 class I SAM-dependent methyltransferase [Vibrio sp. KJ40-1]